MPIAPLVLPLAFGVPVSPQFKTNANIIHQNTHTLTPKDGGWFLTDEHRVDNHVVTGSFCKAYKEFML